jgi:hypothetical protein
MVSFRDSTRRREQNAESNVRMKSGWYIRPETKMNLSGNSPPPFGSNSQSGENAIGRRRNFKSGLFILVRGFVSGIAGRRGLQYIALIPSRVFLLKLNCMGFAIGGIYIYLYRRRGMSIGDFYRPGEVFS